MHAAMTPAPPDTEALLQALRGVRDPHTGLDIVTLGWVTHLSMQDPDINLTLALPRSVCARTCTLESAIERALLPHLGSAHLRLRIRWNAGWDPAEG